MKDRLKRITRAGGGYPFAVVLVLAVAALLMPLRSSLEAPTLMLLFVPVIIGLARFFGIGVSAAASVLAFLLLDYLFVPPYDHLAVDSLPEWLGLLAFLAVALVAGQQTNVLRSRERAAVRRQAGLEFLSALSSRIIAAGSVEQIAGFVVEQAVAALGARRAAVYLPGDDDAPAVCVASAGAPLPSPGEQVLAGWSIRHAGSVGVASGGAGVLPQRDRSASAEDVVPPGVRVEGVYIPLSAAGRVEGVLHVLPPDKTGLNDDSWTSLLAAMANLVAASFERRRLEEAAARADALREADRLRTTFISSVSHELKTPLAAATARVTGLLDEADPGLERTRSELGEIAEDLARLNDSIGDLLDVSRLEAHAWRPELELYELAEVLGAVLAHLPSAQKRRVRFTLQDETAPVCCDFTQLVRALGNLVENALAYSPSGSPVRLSSWKAPGEILISVEDAGPGVADADRLRVFEKFYRGAAASSVPGGTGLGLAIAAEIVRTHGGRIWIEDADPTGARFVVSLPAGGCRGERADGSA